jgi:hypothetical protein
MEWENQKPGTMPSCLSQDLGRGHNDTCCHVVVVQRYVSIHAGYFLSASWEHVSVQTHDAAPLQSIGELFGHWMSRTRGTLA